MSKINNEPSTCSSACVSSSADIKPLSLSVGQVSINDEPFISVATDLKYSKQQALSSASLFAKEVGIKTEYEVF